MADVQRGDVDSHEPRRRELDIGRFDVQGFDADNELVSAVARRLAEGDAASGEAGTTIRAQVGPAALECDRILRALRKSALVGADLEDEREIGGGGHIDV